MRRKIVPLVAGLLLALGVPAAAGAAPRLQSIGTFSEPTSLTGVPGRPGTVAVTERAGRVILVTGGTRSTLLDIRDLVHDGYVEQGLLSVAFAPDYATSGRFYVFYTDEPSGNLRVEEYTRSASDPDAANPDSARFVIGQQHSDQPNHNGGQLQFGADGDLYISMGDGGGQGDPEGDAQDLGNLLGKILRIDPRGGVPYAIPSGNPYTGVPGAREELWAYGLRNAWRFSFDRGTGAIAIGDVGQDTYEEVDFVTAADGAGGGRNFGWNHFEANSTFPGGAAISGPGVVTAPVLVYDHDHGCSITGGYVVRDPGLPTLAGRYLYGDYCRPNLHSAALPDGTATDREEPLAVDALSSLGEDDCGHVYVMSLNGDVSRVVDAPSDACAPASPGGPGGGTGGGGGGTTPGADTVAPTLLVSAKRRQAILPRHRGLKVIAECNEACAVRATVTVRLGGKRRLRLTARSGTLPASARGSLRWNPRRALRRRIARALRARHPHVSAVVRVSANDAAGNAATPRRITVRITRR